MPPALVGVLCQLAALALFVGLDTCTKWLAQHHAVPQIMFARFAVHVAVVALALRVATGALPWRSRAPGLQTARSLTLAACNLLFSFALAAVPLADATAVGFASPLLTVALAAWWLGERVAPRRWAGVLVGLLGVLVALRPPFLTGAEAPPLALLLPLATAALFAAYAVMTRVLAGLDDPRTTVLHTGLAATAATALAQPFAWTTPETPLAWALLGAAGLFGAAGHYLLVLAYARAPASLLAPMSYTQLVWAVAASALVFGDRPDGWTLAGAAVIAAGGVMVAWPTRDRANPGAEGPPPPADGPGHRP